MIDESINTGLPLLNDYVSGERMWDRCTHLKTAQQTADRLCDFTESS